MGLHLPLHQKGTSHYMMSYTLVNKIDLQKIKLVAIQSSLDLNMKDNCIFNARPLLEHFYIDAGNDQV